MDSGFNAYTPRRSLSDYVAGLWSYGGYVQPHGSERLLPTGTMTLAVRLDEDGICTTVSGPHSCAMVLDTSKPFSVVAAAFRPGGGFPFFGLPAGELGNANVALDLLPGLDASFLHEQLLEAPTPLARFRVLEAFLLDRLSARTARSPAVCRALDVFHSSGPVPRVAAVAGDIGWTPQRLINRFRHEVGLTPKVYSRIMRFRNVIATLDGRTEVDWADVALSCGYFDQAHFIHDFKGFAGVTPSAYLRDRVSTNHVRVG